MRVAESPMKKLICILVLLFQLIPLRSEQQENAVSPPRTPEQEAVMQTNKMRRELGLSADQAKTIYEINLRHARERQSSTSRSEALKRVKHKEEELQRVLNPQQYNKLQEKRTDYNPATREVDAVVNGRTRPITNPQRIESGRSVRMQDINTQRNISRERLPSQHTSPASRSSESNQRRDASPATSRPATVPDYRRSQPEGTRYVPERQSSSSRSASPASNQSSRSGSSSGTRSSSGGSSSGSRSSSGNRR